MKGFCGLQLKTFTAPEAAFEPPSLPPQAASANGTPRAATAMTAQRLRVLTRMVDPFPVRGGQRSTRADFVWQSPIHSKNYHRNRPCTAKNTSRIGHKSVA